MHLKPAKQTPPGKRRKRHRNAKVASPGPRRSFFSTPASRLINAEPKKRTGDRSLNAARVHGTSFGVMIDAMVRVRPKAQELVASMTKNNDEALDPRAEEALNEMASVVLAKKTVTDDFGKEQAVPIFDTKSRISAAKVLLEYTKQKPKTVQQVELSTEDWLEQLDEDDS